MAKLSKPRAGSLQIWPRKRAEKFLPSVNWAQIKGEGILGIIAYKVGMATALVKDNTEHSMTKGKKMVIPVTVLEVPPLKIFSIRFYRQGRVLKEFVVTQDAELKRKLRVPKQLPSLAPPADYDDVQVLAYSLVKKTGIKKTPDLAELAMGATTPTAKFEFAKALISKELMPEDIVKATLVDVRGLTKGKGFEGSVPRFGISLRQHKSEKGVRRPGSLGPWHPAHVTFRTPQAGQLGMFSRVHYNLKVVSMGNIAEKDINPSSGFKHYGLVRTSYVLVKGSVQGPPKRQLLLTPALRPTRGQLRKKYEFLELLA